MTDRLIQDAEARRVARTEFVRPVVLRAGAGTGKTAALVARVVAWVTGRGWDRSAGALGSEASPTLIAGRTLGRVVAITFTEAAAAEMAERIAVALHALGHDQAESGIVLSELHADASSRARCLLPAVDQLEVRTIHAWCRKILAQYPLEARIHPVFDVDASGDRVARLVRRTVEEQLSQGIEGEQSEIILSLFERGISPADIESAVTRLVAEAIDFDECTKYTFNINDIDASWLRIRNAVTALIDHIGDALDGIRAPNATALLAGLIGLRDGLNPGESVQTVQSVMDACLPEKLRAHMVKAWVNDKGGKAETAALEATGFGLAALALEVRHGLVCIGGLDPHGYQLAQRVIGPAVKAVQAAMVSQGILGFSDLLVRAARLLKNQGLATALRSRIDQLLVDEFQDTDPRQCDIVRAIALQGGHAQRPGLFLVGDPKQSIYGWRSADLSAYEDFVAEVIANGGVEHGLIQNFRSTAQLLEVVDRCMAPLFRPIQGVQPSHESLIAARGKGDDVPALEAWVSWTWTDGVPDAVQSAEAARWVEADALADDLVRLQGEGVCLSEVGVLFRSTTHLQVYQWALRDAGIPYEVSRDRNYFKRKEVVESIAMIRAVLDPADTLALVSFLRSPMVGVPDAALMPLWAAGFPGAWARLSEDTIDLCVDAVTSADSHTRQIETHVSGLDELRAWSHQLKAVVRSVAGLRSAFKTTPEDIWVDKLRSELLPDVLGAVAYQGVYRVANLEQLFRLFCEQLKECSGNVRSVLAGLRDAIARQRDAEESRPSGNRSAVQLMTIHKSKGLAFGHVYLVDLHHRFRVNTVSKGTEVSGKHGLQLAGLWPPGFDRVWTRAKRVEEAERVRLLYVAMTRARDRLVLMGAWPQTLRGLDRPKMIVDLLGASQPPLSSPVEIAATLGPMTDQVDANGVRWVFPGKLGRKAPGQGTLVGGRGSAETGGVALRPTAEVSLEAARARQSRPWSMGPSSAGEDTVVTTGGSTSRDDALVVGTAIHKLLEDLAKGSSDLSDAALNAAICWVSGNVAPSAKAWTRACALRDVLVDGALMHRLGLIEVLGTEVPMLMTADLEGPTSAWTGSIDLIYRCPETHKIVVADYKTDHIGSRDPSAVAAHHAAQGRVYTQAVKQALGLDVQPVFEVWLVEIDRRIAVC